VTGAQAILPAEVLPIISAVLALAKRYKWVESNVAEDATMPSVGRPPG
jgi:hypothetical protein